MDIKKPKETEFQGPISLQAILAAKSAGNNPVDKLKVEDHKIKVPEIVEEEEEEEEIVAPEALKPEARIVPEVGTEKPVATEETEAYKAAKRLIKLGILEDFSIQTSDEDEDGTPISEFINMTEENLEEIVKMHNQEKQKENSEKFLPKGDLKEHQLKIFEILSNGGDLSQIADTPDKAMERPFEGFDMDVQERQIDVRYTDLVHSKGLDHESAITIIEKEVRSGKIKESSKEIFENYRDAHTSYIDEILEKQKKDREFKDLNFKENKKLLTAKLKESGLKESVYKKVATEYEKKDENGEFALINKLREALNKPEENHELILHLADSALFNETFKIKASQETVKTIRRLATGAASKGNKQTLKTQNTQEAPSWLRNAQKHNENINN